MKKRILFIIAFVIIVAMFAGCKNKEENDNPVTNNNVEQVQNTEKQLNETYELNNSTTTIKEELGASATVLEESEVLQKYNLGEMSNLEKKVLVNSTSDSYEEVAIIKLTNVSQEFTIQQMMYDRYESLKEEYKENTKILNMLEDSKNVKIKIQDGVGVLIISDKADELMQTFDSGF